MGGEEYLKAMDRPDNLKMVEEKGRNDMKMTMIAMSEMAKGERHEEADDQFDM